MKSVIKLQALFRGNKSRHNLNFNRLNVKNEKIINPSRW